MFFHTDPIVLGAEAREMLTKLHERGDVVVKMKTDKSGYAADKLSDAEKASQDGGHYTDERKILSINLDKVLAGKEPPVKLNTIEDWRLYPVLAGVAAHESGHARWSRWHDTKENPFPGVIPNPEHDPAHPVKMIPNPDHNKPGDELSKLLPETVEDPDYKGPISYPVDEKSGKLVELAKIIEEPRVERLGRTHYTKTWKKAMEFSASYLTLETVDEMEDDDTDPLDSAVRLAALVGGRLSAGTLGATTESRASAQRVLDSAQRVIETALPQTPDAFFEIMGLVNGEVFNNDHDDALSHLEAARQILAIVHPESQDDPDSGDSGDSEGGSAAMGMTSGGEGDSAKSDAAKAAMILAIADAAADLESAMNELGTTSDEIAHAEAEAQEAQQHEGYGTTEVANPLPPQISYYDEPNADDQALYRRARIWMELQIQNTIIESEYGQWLPGGGSRLNVRSMIRDDLAGHEATQRTDWDRVSETVKPAPPVKIGILLDGSGSMGRQARFSAGVAWAVANAAADLPESRTVSIVFGNKAAVTQEPGRGTQKQVAVAHTNGGTEDFKGAAKLVEEHLQLDPMGNNPDNPDGEPENVLIIIVSDLMFFGLGQAEAAAKTSKEWVERGYKVVNIGCDLELLLRGGNQKRKRVLDVVLKYGTIELTKKENLFK